MAILINLGQRGFVLKEGYLNPGAQITVDQETADRLTKAYPKELKEVKIEPIKAHEAPKAEKAEAPKEVEPTPTPVVEEAPKATGTAKKTSRRKKGK